MTKIEAIQSQVFLSIFDKLVSLLVQSNFKIWVISSESVNFVMHKFSNLFSILNDFYIRIS